MVVSSDFLLFLAVLGGGWKLSTPQQHDVSLVFLSEDCCDFNRGNGSLFTCLAIRALLDQTSRDLSSPSAAAKQRGGNRRIAAMSYRPLSLSAQESLKKDDEASRAGRINGDENT